MERRRGSRMGEALAELDVEDDMVRFLRAVGDGGGEADVDREEVLWGRMSPGE